MKTRIFLMTALALMIGVQVAAAGTWNIDANHSSVGFKVRHFFSKVTGEFTNFSGTVDFGPDNMENTKVSVEIDAASVNTNSEKRDGHLQSDDFFAVETHPTLTFTSTSFKKGEDGWVMEGLLTMRGVEKQVSLNVEFLGSGPNGWGGQTAGFSATGKLNRKDFGVSWNKVLDTGGTVLSDEVEFSIEIEAVEATEESGE